MKLTLTKIFAVLLALGFMAVAGIAVLVYSLSSSLPQMIKVEDYKPLLGTQVFARGGEKIGEYSRANRTIITVDKVPKFVLNAFISAEDSQFYEHSGVNYIAILRAFLVNLTSGEKRQGASTITQQVARALLLSSEKTYTRKIKEILLAQKMEENLSKDDILFLYLNQIFFGENAYGIVAAADVYFRKPVDKLTLAEAAILAGLPQAPAAYRPSDRPAKAKVRQKYVLARMLATKHITEQQMQQALNEPIKVYTTQDDQQVAPYFVETLRQLLVQLVGEKAVWDEGLRVYTSIDFKAQQAANEQVQIGLREIDKRQGYRGPLRTITNTQEQDKFLIASRRTMNKETSRIIKPDGNFEPERPLTIFHKKDGSGKIVTNIPEYATKGQIVEALVTKIDDSLGLVTVRFGDGIGLIDIDEMSWARKPDNKINPEYAPKISVPSAALKAGDVILAKIVAEKFTSARLMGDLSTSAKRKKSSPAPANLPKLEEYAHLSLEQKPLVEGALLSFDQKTGEVIAMVGGYEFIRNKNEFNRTVQAKRQTGSSFKTIVYAAALDKGYTPATLVQDSPLVYSGQEEGQDDGKTWKPHNHEQKFEGDILFRKALVRSLNIPSVKILEDVSVSYTIDYAKRLGIFSPLNADLSLALGSSSLTLYEITKVFSHFGRLGQRIRPTVIHKILNKDGGVVLENISLDKRFEKDVAGLDRYFEEKRKALAGAGQGSIPTNAESNAQAGAEAAASETQEGNPEVAPAAKNSPYFFNDPNQLIRPQTAYLMTTLLQAVVNEGTAARALSVGRPIAGKTGSTNGYFDGWFVGYSPQIVTGVWVGFDEEKSLGPGQVGGKTALPIWIEYMKAAHKDLPIIDFTVPAGIVFANIDGQTGDLASSSSTSVVRQAFVTGTAPKKLSGASSPEDDTEFLKKDLTE